MEYTVLVVEDDNIIRRGLVKTIRELGLPIGEIRSAADGREALTIWKSAAPDIVLTDVRMPGMSGLTFIERSRRLPGKAQYIILSGYDEFSYAKRGIRLGVLEYLLKPVKIDSLRSILSYAMERREAEVGKGDRERRESKVLRSALDSVQATVLRGILDRSHDANEGRELLEKLAPDPDNRLVTLIVCRTGSQAGLTERVAAESALRRYLGDRFGLRFSYRNRYGEVSYLLEAERNEVDELEEFYHRLDRYLNDPAHDFFDGAHVGASGWLPRLSSVPELAEQAFDALDRRILEPEGRLFRHTGGERHTPRPIDRLSLPIGGGSRAVADRELRRLWEEVRGPPPCGVAVCRDRLYVLLFALFRNLLDDPREFLSRLDVEGFYRSSDSLQALHERILSQVPLRARTATVPGVRGDSIQRALRYIDENYYRDLDLETVASAVQVNPNYLCSRFRKKTGERFVKYLQRVRVEEAKRLLTAGTDRIVDVALAVGFQEDKYFHKIFKDVTGLTPAQYRAGQAAAEASTPGPLPPAGRRLVAARGISEAPRGPA